MAMTAAAAASSPLHGMDSQCGRGVREKQAGSSTVMLPSRAGTIEKEDSDGMRTCVRAS